MVAAALTGARAAAGMRVVGAEAAVEMEGDKVALAAWGAREEACEAEVAAHEK